MMSTSTEGTIPFAHAGESFDTWYKAFGELEKFNTTPFIVLHGGPGLSHDYLLPLADLANSRPVIFYDQLGNARSTHLPHKPAEFWTIDLFIDELVNLVNHFGFQDNFALIGHSWGGMLAFEFELRRRPAGLKYIVASNSLASIPAWHESNRLLTKEFPEWVQEGIAIGIKDLAKAGPAMLEFRKKHGCRLFPFPEEYVRTQMSILAEDADRTVLKTMWPKLSTWNIESALDSVRIPVLLINGRYDTSQDFVNAPIFRNLPKVKWVTFAESSHTPFWEERERYMKVVGEFMS